MKISHWSKILIGIAILFFVWQGWNVAEYKNHHKSTVFEVHGEQKFLEDFTIHIWPYSEQWVIDMINSAKEKIYISVYTFTLPEVRESLLRAHERWVDVRIILEKFPFGNTSINRETISFFQENALPLHLSGEWQFAFMHAKYMIIDDRWIVETANWTRASFSSNREVFLTGNDTDIQANLERIFLSDFAGWKWEISLDIRLLTGPVNARERLLDFATQWSHSISLYAPSFSDGIFLQKLHEFCMAGNSVRILLADYEDEDESQKPDYGTCIEAREMKKPLHAKAVLRSDWYAFVGSFNFTKNSIENNREVGIFIVGASVKKLLDTFEADWKLAELVIR